MFRYNNYERLLMTVSLKQITPLRYPGGKAKLGPWLSELIHFNGINGGYYIEPYAGGAGAAFYLLMSGAVKKIIINDLDPAIYYFWWAVLNDTEWFLKKINNTSVCMEEWRQQKEVIKNMDRYSRSEIGFATFFLNRTNMSGILKAGVIGGKNQNGNYKMNVRFNKETLIERIKYIKLHKTCIELYNLDAIEFIDKVVTKLPEKKLVYFDPPYYLKGSQLYRNHYRHNDHLIISKSIKKLKCPWLITYDNCNEIKSLYSDVNIIEFSLRYSTHRSRLLSTEIMFYKNLQLHEEPQLLKQF